MAGADFLLCNALFLFTLAALLFTTAAVALNDESKNEQRRKVTFVNELPETPVDLYWENHETGDRKLEGTIYPRGGFHRVDTYHGHGKRSM
jgi:hypothetical protein